MESIAEETRVLLYWASKTKWENMHTNFADAVNRWKDAGTPDLPDGPLCPHCGKDAEVGAGHADKEQAAQERDDLKEQVALLVKEVAGLKAAPPPPPVQKKATKRRAVKTPNPFERIQRTGPNKFSAARRRAALLARQRVVLDLLDQWSTASDVAAVCDAPAGMVRATLVRLVMSGTVLVREPRFGQTGVSGRPARQFKVYKQGDQR